MSKLIVKWNDPKVNPEVELNKEKTFWVAIQSTNKSFRTGETTVRNVVFAAQYVNRPIELDDDGYPTNDDHFVTEDGEPMEAVGWFSVREHADFNGFYDHLETGDDYLLLGWAEYEVPEFK